MADAAEEIAPGGISLVDAYERVFHAMNPEVRRGYPRTRAEWDEHDYAELCANEVVRNGFADGSLGPLVYVNGTSREISRNGWKIPGQFPRQDWMPDCFPQTGIGSNFVGPNDPTNPGPRTDIDGKRHAVFVDPTQFDGWFNSIFPVQRRQTEKVANPHRGGKKKGDGSYRNVDAPLQRKMKSLIQQGKATSARAAARLLLGEAYGEGTDESKIDRLAKGYNQSLRNAPKISEKVGPSRT
jgi:hypothetical protein